MTISARGAVEERPPDHSGLPARPPQHAGMGLLDSFKRTFNIGGCAIAIHPAADALRQGEAVAGTVALRGGDFAQEARSLRIALVEFWTERRGSGKNRRTVTVTREEAAQTLAGPLAIAPGEERALPFRLALPRDARLSEPGRREGWRLEVGMDVPGAVDPTGSLGLAVGPAAALLDLVALWQEVLRWSEDPGRRSWDRAARTTCFRFRPPGELAGDFDHLDLACRPLPDGDWQAALSFDLQEKSLLDRLKALIDIDKAERGLRIPAAALAGDRAARTACAQALVQLMQGIIAAR